MRRCIRCTQERAGKHEKSQSSWTSPLSLLLLYLLPNLYFPSILVFCVSSESCRPLNYQRNTSLPVILVFSHTPGHVWIVYNIRTLHAAGCYIMKKGVDPADLTSSPQKHQCWGLSFGIEWEKRKGRRDFLIASLLCFSSSPPKKAMSGCKKKNKKNKTKHIV